MNRRSCTFTPVCIGEGWNNHFADGCFVSSGHGEDGFESNFSILIRAASRLAAASWVQDQLRSQESAGHAKCMIITQQIERVGMRALAGDPMMKEEEKEKSKKKEISELDYVQTVVSNLPVEEFLRVIESSYERTRFGVSLVKMDEPMEG